MSTSRWQPTIIMSSTSSDHSESTSSFERMDFPSAAFSPRSHTSTIRTAPFSPGGNSTIGSTIATEFSYNNYHEAETQKRTGSRVLIDNCNDIDDDYTAEYTANNSSSVGGFRLEEYLQQRPDLMSFHSDDLVDEDRNAAIRNNGYYDMDGPSNSYNHNNTMHSSNNHPRAVAAGQAEAMRHRNSTGSGTTNFCGLLCRCCECLWILVNIFLLLSGAYIAWVRMGSPMYSRDDVVNALSNAVNRIKNFDYKHFDVDDFTNVLDNLTDSIWDKGFNEDPYVGDSSMHAWKTNGYGLSLVLYNALDDEWQTEFSAAVEDWSESTILDLTAVQVDVDHNCTRVEGLMKVCNGNFGDSGWLGINEIEMEVQDGSDVGYIISSVAKMNEYYLKNAVYESRQYTMCHEIGTFCF